MTKNAGIVPEKEFASVKKTPTVVRGKTLKKTTVTQQTKDKSKISKSSGVLKAKGAIASVQKIKIAKNVILKNTKSEKATSENPNLLVSRLPMLRTGLSVSKLSPFRLPIDGRQLASQVARYTGLLFVVLGAICTYFNIQNIEPYMSMVARHTEMATVGLYNCDDPNSSNYFSEYCATSDARPVPELNIESQYGESLYGVVPVHITVPMATSVTVYAYSVDRDELILLGSAQKISDLVWNYNWNTEQYEENEYVLKVTLMNRFGPYSFPDQKKYSIIHELPTNTTDAGTSGLADTSPSTTDTSSVNDATPSSTSSTTTVPTVLPDATVNFSKDMPLNETTIITTEISGASVVKHFIRPRNTNSFTTLGYAYFDTTGAWKYTFNTTAFENGSYVLKTKVTLSDNSTQEVTSSLTIKNETTQIVSTTTPNGSVSDVSTTLTQSPVLVPDVKISLPISGTLSDTVDVFIGVKDVQFVELYMIPAQTLTKQFVGLAKMVDQSTWRYSWNTKNTPNGTYTLYARVRNAYGDTDAGAHTVTIFNKIEPVQTTEKTVYVETLTGVGVEAVTARDTEILNSTTIATHESVLSEIESDEDREEIRTLMDEFSESITRKFDKYARAARNEDAEAMKNILDDLEEIRRDVLNRLPDSNSREELTQTIDTHLSEMITALQEVIEHNESFIRERVGDALKNDSDNDGVTDYDEVNIYSTNPYTSDSDGDGYSDGSEIMSGYDPTNSETEAYVQYESPKETGIVRDDILTTVSITTISDEESGSKHVAALISGVGLPNGFVTLHIFSTPIIVTVKTDNDGNWSYIFDKELEDGEHEIYVSMTDNAGRIVMKSNPFAFIKMAQAFTPVDADEQPVSAFEASSPTLFSQSILLVVASIAVVALGLVLILLGIHVSNPRPREFIEAMS